MGVFRRILAGAIAGAMFLSGGSAWAASGQHEVTANRLNFREEASTDSDTIAALSDGTVVTVLSTSGDWAKARWNGRTGYLSLEYLDRITAESKDGRNTTKLSGTGWLEKDSVLYEAADTASDEAAELSKGTKLSLRGETMSFYYVKADGKTGYVLKNRVSTEETEREEEEKEEAPAAGKARSSGSSMLRKGDENSDVRELQKRLSELNYLDDGCVTGYYGDMTFDAVKRFQARAGLDVDGVAGPATLRQLHSDSAPKQGRVIAMDWFASEVSSLVAKRGGMAYIVDCDTGVKIKIRRVGGSNHMDVEPASASDTKKLLKLYGGEWSWDQRAVILQAGGKQIAASINGMPHGDEISTDNDFEGHFCLHTTGSMTHGTEKVNGRHQDKVEEALTYND